MSKLQLLTKGIIRENPTFVLLLGMCPTLGTTTSAVNGMGMGLATLFVLTLSNVVISLVKNLIPAQVRIPSFIVVIAAFVTVVQLCMEAYTPVIGAVREMLGSGAIFGMKFIHGDGMLLFILAPGAFIVLGYLLVLFNKLTAKLK